MGQPAAQANYEKATAFVASHPEPCRLTLAELIEGAGLARATLYRAFKGHGGVNAFLISIRLEAARELLASGLTCKEVSRRCGFKAQSHFSKRFLAAYGVHAATSRRRLIVERGAGAQAGRAAGRRPT